MKIVTGGILKYLFKRVKKPIIQNLIDIIEFPVLVVYMSMLFEPWYELLENFDHILVGDSSEKKINNMSKEICKCNRCKDIFFKI